MLLSHESAMSKTTSAMIATVEADPFSAQPTQPFETRRISYFELYTEVNRCAQALRKLGVKPGDSVGSFAATNCEMLTVFLATVSSE
jgi:acyl-coenzyme A synthetase/AMP-(fatty) acid ligase